MTHGIETMVRDLYHAVDEDQTSLSASEMMHRAGPVRALPSDGMSIERSWRIPLTVAASAAAVVALIGGLALINMFRDNAQETADKPPPIVDSRSQGPHYEVDWTYVPSVPGYPTYVLDDNLLRFLVSTPTGSLMPDVLDSSRMLRLEGTSSWTSEPLPGRFDSAQGMYQFDDTVVVAEPGGRFVSSTDGVTWSEHESASLPDLTTVQYAGVDLESLEELILPWSEFVYGTTVIRLSSGFVAYLPPTTDRGQWQVFTSPNGTTWSTSSAPGLDGLTLLGMPPHLGFFGVRDDVVIFSGHESNEDGGPSATRLMRSADGLVWTEVTPRGFGMAPGVKAIESGWIAGGGDSGLLEPIAGGASMVSSPLYYSPDGISWTEIKIKSDPIEEPWVHVAIAGDTMIRWGRDGARPDYQIASLRSLHFVEPAP